MRGLIERMAVFVCIAPGDRSHIPDSVRPAYDVIVEQLNHLRQTSPVRLVF